MGHNPIATPELTDEVSGLSVQREHSKAERPKNRRIRKSARRQLRKLEKVKKKG